MRIERITDAEALGPFLAEARTQGRCAMDTEFVWERTYAPALCLIQIATADRLAVIDPVEGAPTAPVAELVADPAVTKVMHAAVADLAAFALHHDVHPRAVWDTQVAAGFAGRGGSLSLERLLDAVLGVRLHHDEGFTDWQRRPLTETQVEYAADDVRHLLAAADALSARLDELGRRAWLDEELDERFGRGRPDRSEPCRCLAPGRRPGQVARRATGDARLDRRMAGARGPPPRHPGAVAGQGREPDRGRPRRPRNAADAARVRGLQLRKGGQLEGLLRAVGRAGEPPPSARARAHLRPSPAGARRPAPGQLGAPGALCGGRHRLRAGRHPGRPGVAHRERRTRPGLAPAPARMAARGRG